MGQTRADASLSWVWWRPYTVKCVVGAMASSGECVLPAAGQQAPGMTVSTAVDLAFALFHALLLLCMFADRCCHPRRKWGAAPRYGLQPKSLLKFLCWMGLLVSGTPVRAPQPGSCSPSHACRTPPATGAAPRARVQRLCIDNAWSAAATLRCVVGRPGLCCPQLARGGR